MHKLTEADVLIKPGILTREHPESPEAALRGSRCRACRESFFPFRAVCPRCKTADTTAPIELSRAGIVYSCTRVERTPEPYRDPYVLARVDLPEGVRILTQIAIGGGDDVQIGMPVELVIEPLFDGPGGARVWGYRFRPVSTEGAR